MHYMVVPVVDVTQQMIDAGVQTSMATLRKSLDGKHCVLKHQGAHPSCLQGYPEYEHAEILKIVASADWDDSD